MKKIFIYTSIVFFAFISIGYIAFNIWMHMPVGEGGEYISFDKENRCAEGLRPIAASVVSGSSCAYPKCPCHVCTKCGDSICGEGENFCNCESDCSAPEGYEKPIEAKSIEDCLRIDNNETLWGKQTRDGCILAFVTDRKEVIAKDACDKIENLSSRYICTETLAKRLKDPSLCTFEKLNNQKSVAICLRNLAVEMESPELCNKITDMQEKSFCETLTK